MILFAEQKPILKKQKKLATPELEKICIEGCYATSGLNLNTKKQGTFCTKELGTCIYQSTRDRSIVSEHVKLTNGSTRYLPQCMIAPDYQQTYERKKT